MDPHFLLLVAPPVYDLETFQYGHSTRQRPTRAVAQVRSVTRYQFHLNQIGQPLALRDGATTDALPMDTERGHLIANVWGGPGDDQNLVPMYGHVNRGQWARQFEAAVANRFDNGTTRVVRVEVTCEYPAAGGGGDPRIPVRFRTSFQTLDPTGVGDATAAVIGNAAPARQQRPSTVAFHRRLQAARTALPAAWRIEAHRQPSLHVGMRVPLTPGPYRVLDYLLVDGTLPGNVALTDLRNAQPFSAEQRELILKANRDRNAGYLVSDDPNDPNQHLVEAPASHSGAEVDHIVPRSNGGSNAFSNAQLVSRAHNNAMRAQIAQAQMDALPRRSSARQRGRFPAGGRKNNYYRPY